MEKRQLVLNRNDQRHLYKIIAFPLDQTPFMAALPASLLKVGYPAFTHTGVDYFGPIKVTIFRRTMKR